MNKNNQKSVRQLVKGVSWLCKSCRGLLGCFNEARTQLRMKYKDFYAWVEAPTKITILCRFCGELNVVESTKGGENYANI